MALWKADVDKLLPGSILQLVIHNGDEIIEDCDKLRIVKIMSQAQNWDCTEEETVERIKTHTTPENPFTIGDEKFWYEKE